MKYAIVDTRSNKVLIKSGSEELIREIYKAYSKGWGRLSGYVISVNLGF